MDVARLEERPTCSGFVARERRSTLSHRPINWFPGHMAKARRWVTEALPRTDLVLEVVDARLPQSSQNLMIQEICGARSRLTVFCKADLADPEITKRWLAGWPLPAVVLNTKDPKLRKGLLRDIRAQAPERGGPGKPLRVLVVGIPNVGKSSIVNFLSLRRIARVGDEPAITRQHQQIDLKNGILLIDTPSILWSSLCTYPNYAHFFVMECFCCAYIGF
jgi:ribosome biogenesis GTPase A